jgi:hypothetical protein
MCENPCLKKILHGYEEQLPPSCILSCMLMYVYVCLMSVVSIQHRYIELFGVLASPSCGLISEGASESSDEFTDMFESAKKNLNAMCQQNRDGNYCISERTQMADATSSASEAELSCESDAMKHAVKMGCCYGSFLASNSKRSDQTNKETLSLKRCGGTLVPCTDGAMMSSTVVESDLTLSGEGKAFMMPPVRWSIIDSIMWPT